MSDETDASRTPAIRVTGGGEPTAAQLAALVLALTPGGDDGGAEHHAAPRLAASGWARAAKIEGIGGRPAASLPDLVQGRFGLGHVGDHLAED